MLFSNYEELYTCLSKAPGLQMPKEYTLLFAIIITANSGTSSTISFNQYEDQSASDFRRARDNNKKAL